MRTKNSFLTMLTSLIPIFIIGFLGFIKIRYFIDILGSEANGLIQMIYRILSYLSLAELGIGGAILFKLYKPLREHDEKKISLIASTAGNFFRKIGYFILAFLVCFMFVIPLIIKNNTFSNKEIYILFLLAGLPYAIEYIWYKKYYILIAADQKQYLNNIIFNSCTIIYDILLIIFLIKGITLTQYILISYPFVIVKGIILYIIYKKNYPYVKQTKVVDKDTVSISKDVFIHNIGSTINNSSDQIVLSIFSGLALVSIYSSYIYVVKYLKDITNAILKSTLYSFGNLFSDEQQINNDSYKIYQEFLSFSSVLSIIVTATFTFAVLPFINIWINNPAYILELVGVYAFSALVYSNIITIPLNIATGATGLFKQTKYYSFLATIVNIFSSILLIKKFGIAGIVFATVFSVMFIWFPLVLRVTYKTIFKEHKMKDYYKQIAKSLLIGILIIAFTEVFHLSEVYSNSILNWLLVSLIYFISVTMITFIIYYATDLSFRKFFHRSISLLKLRRNKK